VLSTVAVLEFAVAHVAVDVTSCFVPSGNVASADIFTESVLPTAHGFGETAIADTVADDVLESLPHATSANINAEPLKPKAKPRREIMMEPFRKMDADASRVFEGATAMPAIGLF
jgi:hypothetical protein